MKLQARQARKEEHCDCMAAVILGSFELTDDEKMYITALEEKYDALRMVMLRHCLKLEIGLAWERLVMLMSKYRCILEDGACVRYSIVYSTLMWRIAVGTMYFSCRLDERELHRRVLKKKKEEEKLRQDGKLEQMADLIIPLEKVSPRDTYIVCECAPYQCNSI